MSPRVGWWVIEVCVKWESPGRCEGDELVGVVLAGRCESPGKWSGDGLGGCDRCGEPPGR